MLLTDSQNEECSSLTALTCSANLKIQLLLSYSISLTLSLVQQICSNLIYDLRMKKEATFVPQLLFY